MEKTKIRDILKKKLAPVYQARMELVDGVDSQYFSSASGEAELLNMALISMYMKELPSDDGLKKIHDESFFTACFHENQSPLLEVLRESGWNMDFSPQNFWRLVHNFAEDAGVDDFYNALEEIPLKKAPINRIGDIKNWEEMKHSQVLSAPVEPYYAHGVLQPLQHISQHQIDKYCMESMAKTLKRNMKIIFSQKPQYNR